MECIFTLLAFGMGFLVAQFWKLIAGIISGRRAHDVLNLGAAIGYFSRSGGMPSGHTASLTAAVMYLGFAEGFGTGLFALGACVWMIVLYDAIHVRYAVGEQGKVLNQILKEKEKKQLELVEGHTMGQVVVGAILGSVIGVLMAFVTGMIG